MRPNARHISSAGSSPLAALASSGATRLADVDARGARGFVLGRVDDALLDVGGQAVEGLVDVDVALGRDLEEGNAQFVGKSLALLRGYYPLLLPVAFVADQNLVDALGGVLLDVGEPGADVYRKREWLALMKCAQVARQVSKTMPAILVSQKT